MCSIHTVTTNLNNLNMNNNEYFFNVHTSISIKNTINELNQYLNGNITKNILKETLTNLINKI